jgi:hypothetical protein
MKANGAISRSLFAESGADREDAGSCSPSPGIKLRVCFHFVSDVYTSDSKDGWVRIQQLEIRESGCGEMRGP